MAIHVHLTRKATDAGTVETLKKKIAEQERIYNQFASVGGPPRSHPVHEALKKLRTELKATQQGQRTGTMKDSVESVEKEIATQQRIIDVAKKAGKDVPGQVMQRMAFLKEELEKAKNPRTEDAITDKSRALARKCHQYLKDAVDMAEETADVLDGADKARARQARDSIRKAMQEITPLC